MSFSVLSAALVGYNRPQRRLSVTPSAHAPVLDVVNLWLPPFWSVLSALLTVFLAPLAGAEAAPAPASTSTVGVGATAAEVEVTGVKFSSVRPTNGAPASWLEAAVTLDAKPAGNLAGRMVSRVRVALAVAFELPAQAGAERRLEFYRAEAECVALETGRAEVRFYLPSELVKRDQLHGNAKYWGVEVAVAGRALPAGKGSFAPTLGSADSRKNFLTRAATAAAANEGLLVPQYLSPFAGDYPRATPSFVRREARESANKIP